MLLGCSGQIYGDYSAGIYSNARKWHDMGSYTITGMVNGVAQPVLTQVRDDHQRYAQVFRKMLRFVSFISFPAMLGLAIVAREFLIVISGTKWLESASLLSMLCLYGAFVPIASLYSQLTISMGRSTVNFFSTIGLCLLIWTGLIALRSYGIHAMVAYFVSINILWLAVWQWWAHRLVGLRLWDALRDVLPFFALSALVMLVTHFSTAPIPVIWLRLVTKILLAATLYAGLLWVLRAKILRESIDYLRKRNA